MNENRPGNYPLGSLQSRAAARAKIQGKRETYLDIIFIGSDRKEGSFRDHRVKGTNTVVRYHYRIDPDFGDYCTE